MIDQDAQLKLQAYLDGELPAREAAKVRDWVAREQQAQALLEELRGIGESLHVALNLAAKTKPNTTGHRAAWARAEEATRHTSASCAPTHVTIQHTPPARMVYVMRSGRTS